MTTITKGNYYDSRIGNHSYSMWTTGYDVCIEDGGNKYFYQLRNYDRDRVTTIAPVEMEDASEIAWDELNVNIRKAHFHTINPNGTESEMNLFIYGEEEGAKINAENEWAETHIVYSREITLRLAEELGHFEKVEFLRSVSRWVGTGYKNDLYVIDDKWQVTVSANNYDSWSGSFYASYTIEDYTKIVAQQKAFGRRVARLAKKAGVPWNIGVFVGHIEEDEEAVSILKQVKSARGTADEDMQWELSCGIGRRTAAIEALLGDTWRKLNCSGQRQTTILADYLLGE